MSFITRRWVVLLEKQSKLNDNRLLNNPKSTPIFAFPVCSHWMLEFARFVITNPFATSINFVEVKKAND